MNDTQGGPLRQLEAATRDFRNHLARLHRERWKAEHARARAALDAWEPLAEPDAYHLDPQTGEIWEGSRSTAKTVETIQDAISVATWHRQRDNGQKYRFRKLASCGSRVVIAQCRACFTDGRAVPEGCGIARLCARCSLAAAKQRRARFGRARQRCAIELARVGYTRARRGKHQARTPGGMWTDKMVTLTVPHFLLAHAEKDAPFLDLAGTAKAPAKDATMARIYAVRAAWPLFARKLRAWFKNGGTTEKRKRGVPWVARMPIGVPLADGTFAPPPMHRAFEWTPGADGLGHPHLHVWMIAPFIPAETIAAMWRDALRAVGVPLERDGYVRVQIQRFRDFDGAAVGELVKGGTRQALEWSRLYRQNAIAKAGPRNAFEYADGWTIAEALETARPEVVASLYMALEGMRLTQATRGFFLDDEPASCGVCKAQGCWHVRFAPVDETTPPAERPAPERGPPREWLSPS